jgi:hypothetical protein
MWPAGPEVHDWRLSDRLSDEGAQTIIKEFLSGMSRHELAEKPSGIVSAYIKH